MTRCKHSTWQHASAMALAIALIGSPQAFAQTETSASEELNTQTDEIIVTARKREETILEIPVSISAFSQEALNDRGITDAASLSNFTPGFKFENEGTGSFSGRSSPQIRFRGVGSQATTPASSAGALFWDGAVLSDGAGILPLIDLERVEVIKGPQTAFFGRNTFSGAVNFIPAAPTEEFGGKLIGEKTFTSVDEGHDITAIVNVPIGDRIRTRIALHDSQDPADYEYGDGSPLGEYNNTSIIGSVHFDVSDNILLKYSGAFVDADDTAVQISQPGHVALSDCDRSYSGTYRNVATGENTGSFTTDLSIHELTPPFLSFLSTNFQCGTVADWDAIPFDVPALGIPDDARNSPGFNYSGGLAGLQIQFPEFGGSLMDAPEGFGNTYRLRKHHLSTDIDLTSGHTVSAFVSQSTMQRWSVVDAGFGTGYGAAGDYRVEGYASETKDLSLEARISSPSEQRLRYTAGLSYYNQDNIQANYGVNDILVQEGETIGIFGSADFDITDTVTLSGEGRWHEDTQTILYQGLPGGTDPNAVTDRPQSYSAFMPRVILSYNPSDSLNVYGSFSQSKIQGVATGAVAYGIAEPNSGINESTVGLFTPVQELEAFEVGIKGRLMDTFGYSVAAYNMDWKNQVFFQLNNVFASVFLPGDSKYKGIEIEFDFAATDWFTFSGGFNFVDAEFKDFGSGGTLAFRRLAPQITGANQIDATGNTPRYIPATSGSLSAEFDLTSLFDKAAFLRFDAIHTGSFFLDNVEYNQVEAYTKFNVRAGLNLSKTFSLEIFGNNITNDRSWSPSGGTTGFFSRKTFGGPIEGSEFGAKATFEF